MTYNYYIYKVYEILSIRKRRNTMNKWQKIGLAVGMGAAVVTTTHLINSIIFKSSTANNYTGKRIRSNYQWKFGNIAYVTAGSGSPLLLIHDLNSYSSSY